MKISYIGRVIVILWYLKLGMTCCYAYERVILTGGAGFIGSHVAEALLERGDSVIIIDNMNNYYSPKIKQYNLEIVKRKAPEGKLVIYYADVCDQEKLFYIFTREQPSIICHLAARAGVRPSLEDPELYIKTNVLGTLNMLEMARKFKIKNFVCASSSSVYGYTDKIPFEEHQCTDTPVSPYAATKRAGELLTYVYHYIYRIPCTNLRFFTVYGPRGRPDMAPFMFLEALYHNREIVQYGNGESMRDFTYIDDVVQGVLKAIDTVLPYENFNIGRGQPVRLKEFIATLTEVTGKQAMIKILPHVPGDVSATHANIEKAQRMLGYQPQITLKEGLSRFYAWYTKEYIPLKKSAIE